MLRCVLDTFPGLRFRVERTERKRAAGACNHSRISTWKGAITLTFSPLNLPWYFKIPTNSTPQEAVTLPNNFVTVFHAVTKDLELPLTWPRPASMPPHANDPILIWGGSSSVGQYALQILHYYGYTNLLATASKAHHELLRSLGARVVFDYRIPQISNELLLASNNDIPFVLDCIGSKYGSVVPISKIVKKGAKVAILLPVVVKDATEVSAPEYEMDVNKSASWAEGVVARGVRTHFYLDVCIPHAF